MKGHLLGLLDRARHELAVRFIGEQRMPVKEATLLLGFGAGKFFEGIQTLDRRVATSEFRQAD